jgi:hypothetical protein
MTLQFGRKITQAGDTLQKITLERLFLGISKPKPAFRDLIEQLRTVRSIDELRYRELKKQLPYFVCGIFHPPIRRSEHFASAQHFILDLDHLAEADLNTVILSQQLQQIPEVLMIFASPSADGLKVLFRLKEKCTDRGLFSSFYKIFAQRFAQKNGLEQVIDYKTSDVTRACFLSYDAAAYFQPDAEAVDLQMFIPELDFAAAEKDIKEATRFLAKKKSVATTKEAQTLEKETLLKIKQKLNPHYRKPKEKSYFVPREVESALEEINAQLEDFDMNLLETHPINYGRKVKIACDNLWAELNIFYGKKGFRIVATTKSGSNPELAQLARQVFEQILGTLELPNNNPSDEPT